MKLKDMKSNETKTVECVILNVEEKETKNKDKFLLLMVSDGETQRVLRKWNEKKESFPFAAGQVVLAEIQTEEYKGELTYIAKNLTASSAPASKFVPSAPVEAEKMYQFLYKIADRCGVYAKTVKRILADNKQKLMVCAAGKSMHHNIRAGLLYHTYRMVKTVAFIASSVYNKEPSMLPGCRNVNIELLVAGTILHDLGKLWCMDTNELGASEYTPKEKLMGHLFIGAELAGKYAREDGVDEENVMLLQHLILSHHGEYAYQTVAIPALPEALILHHVDMIDSRMYMFEIQEAELEPGTMAASAYPGLSQNVYRPTWRVPEGK